MFDSRSVSPTIMVGDSHKQPTRRRLFDPVNNADVDAFLDELTLHNAAQINEKWGFDFRAGHPLESSARFEWTPVGSAAYIPPANRETVSRDEVSLDTAAALCVPSMASCSLSSAVDHSSIQCQSGDTEPDGTAGKRQIDIAQFNETLFDSCNKVDRKL